MIIYFDKPLLKETIISFPQWLNTVFKKFLDFGRENIQQIFQQISISVKEKLKENSKNKKIVYLDKKLDEYLKQIKGNLSEDFIETIWDDQIKIEQSNVDKISFEDLLEKLEEIQQLMISSNLQQLLTGWKKKEFFFIFCFFKF